MNSRINWLLLINAALGSFLASTASRIFAVSMPTVASSLETTIVGISWAVIAYQISQISLSLVFGRIGDIYGRQTLLGLQAFLWVTWHCTLIQICVSSANSSSDSDIPRAKAQSTPSSEIYFVSLRPLRLCGR
jgi:MFS family permease